MPVYVDNAITYRNYNTLRLVAPATYKSYTFSVSGMTAISHGLCVYASSNLASAVRAKTRFYGANGLTISTTNHSFGVTAGEFTWQKIENVTVPDGAKFGKFELINSSGTYWAGLIKSESGGTATDFTVNYSGQLTRITASGIYTGTITADQIVLSSTEKMTNRLATINSQFVTLNQTTAGHKSSIDSHTSQLSALGLRVASTESTNSTQNTRLTQVEAGKIVLGSQTSGLIAGMTITSSTLRATSGSYGVQISGNGGAAPIWVGNSAFSTPKFWVTWAGKMHAMDAEIIGKITANSGTIGNWTITGSDLRSETTGGVMLLTTAQGNDSWLYAGPSWGNYAFRVTKAGKLISTGADITGKITATSGKIGGWDLSATRLRSISGSYGVQLSSSISDYPIYVGDSGFTYNGSKFRVTWDGVMVASNAILTGQVTSNASSIIGGSLSSTTGRHNGSHYGYHQGGLYSESGTLGGSGFSSGSYGRLVFNSPLLISSMEASGNIYCDKLYYYSLSPRSDIRLKTNVESATDEFFRAVYDIPIITYEFKTLLGEQKIGVNATALAEKLSPNVKRYLIGVDNEGYLTMNYEALHNMSVLAIQDLNKRVKELERKVA